MIFGGSNQVDQSADKPTQFRSGQHASGRDGRGGSPGRRRCSRQPLHGSCSGNSAASSPTCSASRARTLTTNNPATTPANKFVGRACRRSLFPRRSLTRGRDCALPPGRPHADHQGGPGPYSSMRGSRATRLAKPASCCACRTPGNGRLVVAGASGTRSEFNGDFAWSDYVRSSRATAYASQNKGVLNLHLTHRRPILWGCRLNPSLAVYVHFYDK